MFLLICGIISNTPGLNFWTKISSLETNFGSSKTATLTKRASLPRFCFVGDCSPLFTLMRLRSQIVKRKHEVNGGFEVYIFLLWCKHDHFGILHLQRVCTVLRIKWSALTCSALKEAETDSGLTDTPVSTTQKQCFENLCNLDNFVSHSSNTSLFTWLTTVGFFIISGKLTTSMNCPNPVPEPRSCRQIVWLDCSRRKRNEKRSDCKSC